jgi:hypothetical protein
VSGACVFFWSRPAAARCRAGCNAACTSPALASKAQQAHLSRIGRQPDGVEALPGTYPFTLKTLRRTRNAPGALYSAAGKDGGGLAWDADKEE